MATRKLPHERKRPPRPGEGRPSLYTPEIAAEICARLASGESLRRICLSDHMPSEKTVRWWVIRNEHGMAEEYTQARDLGLDTLADEILEIADTPQMGEETRTGPDGKTVTKAEMYQHRRLRFDARRWYLSKLAPKKYGDKLDLMHRGDSTAPIVISTTDSEL
jgi:hypothetical protein